MTGDYPMNLARVMEALRAWGCEYKLDKRRQIIKVRVSYRKWRTLRLYTSDFNGRLSASTEEVLACIRQGYTAKDCQLTTERS